MTANSLEKSNNHCRGRDCTYGFGCTLSNTASVPPHTSTEAMPRRAQPCVLADCSISTYSFQPCVCVWLPFTLLQKSFHRGRDNQPGKFYLTSYSPLYWYVNLNRARNTPRYSHTSWCPVVNLKCFSNPWLQKKIRCYFPENLKKHQF